MGGRFVSWDEKDNGTKSSGGNDGGMFLKLKAGSKYRVRIIGGIYQYFQHWDPVICRSPGTDDNNQVIDPLMQLGYVPKERFSVWVLDREDGNKLKIMDFPGSLFDQFKEWRNVYSEEFGGKNGPDWQIKVVPGPGGDNKKQKYLATALDRAPLTEEEIVVIKAMNIKEKIAEMRRDNTPEEIRAMIEDAKKKGKEIGGTASGSDAEPVVKKSQEQISKEPEKTTHVVNKTSSGSGDLDF